MPVVSLRDVIEALDLESDELHSYLDPRTGEIVTFNEEEARLAESGEWESAPEWMKEYLPKIKRALEDEQMLEFPDRAHIDEWRMMQDFALEQEQCRCQPELVSAIHGSGAFRRFQDCDTTVGPRGQVVQVPRNGLRAVCSRSRWKPTKYPIDNGSASFSLSQRHLPARPHNPRT